MKFQIFFTFFILVILTGCSFNNPSANVVNKVDTELFFKETLPHNVAILSPLDLDKVDNFEKYKTFAEGMNNLIVILNEQSDTFSIPQFETTREGWEKTLKFINEYGPLINNYNEVVSSAKNFENTKNEENLNKFYIASGKFSLETSVIVFAIFYKFSYETVGIVYRGSGLNKIALECGSCIKVILSETHWALRTIFVEGSSQIAQTILEGVSKYHEIFGNNN